jgi:dethiobiotin synthetase
VAVRMPVVVVGRAGLGGINHARLTIEALRRRKIVVAALVLNRPALSSKRWEALQERSTVAVLREHLNIPVIGPLPYVAELHRRWHQGIADLANTASVKQLASLIRLSAR